MEPDPRGDPSPTQRSLVVTIDGPAGSGKTSTAKEVARRLGFRHLDSGALYRAITVAVLRAGIPKTKWDSIGAEELSALSISIEPTSEGFRALIAGRDPGSELRSARTTQLSSHLARNPNVRAELGKLQRSALSFGNLVAEGRDMGTVVFPDAALKVFLTASLTERTRRRLIQAGRSVDDVSLRREAEKIEKRDVADTTRSAAPLRRPTDALEIDSTEISFESQVSQIVTAAAALTTEQAEK